MILLLMLWVTLLALNKSWCVIITYTCHKFNAKGADYSRKKMIFPIPEVLPIPTNPTFSRMRTPPKAPPLPHHIYQTLRKKFLPSIFRLLWQISHLFRQSTKPFHLLTM
jgi:hypothetical protein